MDLNKLHHELYIGRLTAASSEGEIAVLLRRFPNMPKEYIAFTRKVGELILGRHKDETFFLRIWDTGVDPNWGQWKVRRAHVHDGPGGLRYLRLSFR
jgi:hypothetical protein